MPVTRPVPGSDLMDVLDRVFDGGVVVIVIDRRTSDDDADQAPGGDASGSGSSGSSAAALVYGRVEPRKWPPGRPERSKRRRS